MALTEDEELELLYLEKERRARQAKPEGLSRENRTFYPDVPSSSTGEAIGRGLAESVPFQKELSAVAEKGLGSVLSPELYEDTSIGQLAQENRDINRQVEEEHPAAFGASKIAGQVALSAVPGLAAESLALRGLPSLAKVANVANIGANPIRAATIQGAVQGASDAGPADRGTGAIVGAVAGGATAGVLKTFSNLRKIGQAMEKEAFESSAATLGLTKKAIKSEGEDTMFKIGKMLQEDKITGNPSTLSTISHKIESASGRVNRELGRMYNILEKRVLPDSLPTVEDVVKNVQAKFASGNFPDKRAAAVAQRKLNDLLSKYNPDSKLGPKALRELAQTLEDVSSKFANSSVPAESSARGLLQDAAGLVRTHIHNLSTELGPEFQAAFQNSSSRSGLYKVARDGIQARMSERFQPTQNLGHGIRKALAVSQPVKGAYQETAKISGDFLGWVSKNTKTLGKFAKPLMEAAQRGPAASSATQFVLMQTNPEYREAFKKAAESDKESE